MRASAQQNKQNDPCANEDSDQPIKTHQYLPHIQLFAKRFLCIHIVIQGQPMQLRKPNADKINIKTVV